LSPGFHPSHQSLPAVDDWPPSAPLAAHVARRVVRQRLLRLLQPVVLADSSSYYVGVADAAERCDDLLRTDLQRGPLTVTICGLLE